MNSLLYFKPILVKTGGPGRRHTHRKSGEIVQSTIKLRHQRWPSSPGRQELVGHRLRNAFYE